MKLPDETKELQNFKWSLEFTGLWWNSKEMSFLSKVIHFCKFMVFTCYLILADMSLLRLPSSDLLSRPYLCLSIWYHLMFLTVVYMFLKSNTIVEYHERMKKLIAKYQSDWESQRFLFLNSIVWKFFFWTFTSLMAGLVILAIPAIIDLLILFFTNSTDIFYIPFSLEGFLPEKKERGPQLYFTICLSSLLQIIPLTYYSGFVNILPATVAHIYFALEVMERKLHVWDELPQNDTRRKQIFKEIVEDHTEVLRLLELIKSTIAASFCIQCFSWSINIGIYAHFAKMALSRGDVGVAVTQAYIGLICLTELIISNTIGQILFEKALPIIKDLICMAFIIKLYRSDGVDSLGTERMLRQLGSELSNTIYNLHWIGKPTSEQLDLQMVMRKTQYPVVISFKNTIPLNYYTLTNMMNLSYKIFVILGTMQNE